MPVNLNVGVFANDVEGALELRDFILENKISGWQYDDLKHLNKAAVEAFMERDQKDNTSLFSALYAISLSPDTYDSMKAQMNPCLANGVALVSISNSEALPRGSTQLCNRFALTEGAQDHSLRFEYDEGFQGIPCMEFMSSIVTRLADKKAAGIPCLQCVTTIDNIRFYAGQSGAWLFLQPGVGIDKLSESYVEHISSGIDTIKQTVYEVLELLPLLPAPSITVPSEISNSRCSRIRSLPDTSPSSTAQGHGSHKYGSSGINTQMTQTEPELRSLPGTSPSSTAQGARAARGHGSHESSRGCCSIS